VLANGYRNVTLIRKAVADVTKMVRLYLAPENKGDHRIYDPQDKRDSIAIEAIALDDYFAGEHPRVDFIKMDIQGAEAAALRGMKRVLDCNPEAVLATEFWPTGMRQQGADPWRFVEQLREHGFSLTVVDERGRRLEPTDHARLAAELASPDCRFTNLLCVPFGRDADVRAA
jgi:hypothetical protein